MTEVRALKHNATWETVRHPSHRHFLLFCAVCLAASVAIAAGLLTRRPAPAVVETVTTGLDPQRPPAKTSPVYTTPQLPERDEDVERAGDKIAEATVYLSRRQRTPALRALSEARAAARHAYDRRAQQRDPSTRQLLAAIRELDAAETAVEHGSLPDARQKLVAINRQLDRLNQ